MSVVKRKAAKFSKSELECLLDYLESHPELISAKIGGRFNTLNDIRIAWDKLAEKISEVGGYLGSNRSGPEMKRKWTDLKSRVKAKVAAVAMEANNPEGFPPKLKLTPVEERVMSVISQNLENASDTCTSNLQENSTPAVKVFSFHNDSNSEDSFHDSVRSDERHTSDNFIETEIVQEIKTCGNEDKKRRLSEAFSSSYAERKAKNLKYLNTASEEEQLQELCKSQLEINVQLHTINDILKKCQTSIEKIALLKRAELKLKCAKYGVDFEDLFD